MSTESSIGQFAGMVKGRQPTTWALLGMVVAFVALYWPSFAWMAEEWSSGNALFSHGYLLSAIAVYLIVRSSWLIPDYAIEPQWFGLAVVLGLSFIWLLGRVSNVAVVQTTVVPFIALAAIYSAFGPRIARHSGFAVLYICFALPAWQYLQPPFRDFAVFLIDVTIQAIGIPIQVDGSVIHLPAGSFRIINGCSGINFIVVGLALSSLYGHLYYTKIKPRLILIVTAIVLAIIANWVRVVSLALIGNASKMQSTLVYDHSNYGWLLFSIALVPLFLVARKLERVEAGEATVTDQSSITPSPQKVFIPTIVLILAMATGPIWANVVTSKYDATATANIRLPATRTAWSGPERDIYAWYPTFVGASGEAMGRYDSIAGSVWLYRNIYLSQEQGRELVFLFNKVSGDLRPGPIDLISTQNDAGESVLVKTQVASRGRHNWLIWSWYTVGNRIVAGDIKAKALQSIATLQGRPESGLTAVAVMCAGDCDDARTQLADFLKSGIPFRDLDYDVKPQEI